MAFDETGPGRHASSARSRSASARYRLLTERGRLRRRGHHLRPEHLRDRHRHRGARQLRRRFHRGDALDQARTLPARQGLAAASPTCRSRSAATTACARRSTRCSSTTRSAPAWTWASSTRASSAVYDEIDPELRERVEDVVLNRRADATERLLEVADDACKRRRGTRAPRDLALARRAGRRAPHARAGARHRRLRRRGHRGGAAAAAARPLEVIEAR